MKKLLVALVLLCSLPALAGSPVVGDPLPKKGDADLLLQAGDDLYGIGAMWRPAKKTRIVSIGLSVFRVEHPGLETPALTIRTGPYRAVTQESLVIPRDRDYKAVLAVTVRMTR